MTLKRPESHVLAYQSELVLRNQLPKEWIIRKKEPDYGIDLEVEIVEKEKVTNMVLWLQLKATERIKHITKSVSYRMETKHLKHYEGCSIPVLILYYIKSKNVFYYVFAQRFIKETISLNNPDWRKQKTLTIKFPLESKLEDAESLKSIAVAGRLYIAQQQLNIKSEGFQYWLDGIPQSDDKDLKEHTLNALLCMANNKYLDAITEFEKILKFCVTSHTERMSIFLNLGNAYYFLSQYDESIKNYSVLLELAKKIDKKSAQEAKPKALGNIGLIHSAKGELDEALKYHKDALKIHREIGYKLGEANQLGNIGLIYRDKGELEEALKYHKDALKIHRGIGYKQGEANQLGNIGIIYRAKGELDKALKYLEGVLKIHREIGYKQGEASDLGNIGLICLDKGELEEALKYHKDALKIDRKIGYKQGEASGLGNIGLIYFDKGELEEALKYHKDALKIHRGIGYKQGEANQLGNIGLIHSAKGELDEALKYHKDALKIQRGIGYKQGEASGLSNIGLIYFDKGELGEALKYHKDALKINRGIGYKQGEASDLGNIGLIYSAKGGLEEALKYHKDALKIHRGIGYKRGEASGLGNIGFIYLAKGELDEALKYLEDALKILDEYNLKYGRDIIQRAVDDIKKQK